MYEMTDSAFKLLETTVQRILSGCTHKLSPRPMDWKKSSLFNIVDFEKSPHLYFHMQFGKYACCVVRVGKQFSVQTDYWYISLPDVKCISDENATLRRFGLFDDLQSALNLYFDTCSQIIKICVNGKLDYVQLEIF